MDVYIDKNKRVWIIDFNSFGYPTCALLFEWEELLGIGSSWSTNGNVFFPLDFRFVKNENEKFTSSKGSKRGPIDVHLSNEFGNFMEICKKQYDDIDENDY